MYSFLDLVNEFNDPLAQSMAVIQAEADMLLNHFTFVRPNVGDNYETYVSDFRITGTGSRLMNAGYSAVRRGANSKRSFPLGFYGGYTDIDASMWQSNPQSFNRTVESIVASAPRAWLDECFNPRLAESSTQQVQSFASYCAQHDRVHPTSEDGAPLSLTTLSECLRKVRSFGRPKEIFLADRWQDLLAKLMRNQSLAGNVSESRSELGVPIMYYNGIRFVFVGNDINNDPRLDFNEEWGTETDTTSIYILASGAGGVQGMINPSQMFDHGIFSVTLPDGKMQPVKATTVESRFGLVYESSTTIYRIPGLLPEIVD